MDNSTPNPASIKHLITCRDPACLGCYTPPVSLEEALEDARQALLRSQDAAFDRESKRTPKSEPK